MSPSRQIARWTAGTCRVCFRAIVAGDELRRERSGWIHAGCFRVTHELVSVKQHAKGGYRARCACRWTSARYASPRNARRSWANHVARTEPAS